MNLVREHINEKFVENSDPIQDMNIGIKKVIIDAAKKAFRINMNHLISLKIDEITLYCVGIIIRTNKPIGWKEVHFKNYFNNILKETGLNEYYIKSTIQVNYYTDDVLINVHIKDDYILLFKDDVIINKNNYK